MFVFEWEDPHTGRKTQQAADDKERQKKEKEAFKQKKAGSLRKAFNWALEGDENEIPGYEEYLREWPVIFLGKGGRQVGKIEVSDITEGGYGGILEFNGHEYSVDLNGCGVYLDPFDKKICVELEGITGQDINTDEEFPSDMVDIERTKEAIRRAFNKKVKENIPVSISVDVKREDEAVDADVKADAEADAAVEASAEEAPPAEDEKP